jgi:hypothetical protein
VGSGLFLRGASGKGKTCGSFLSNSVVENERRVVSWDWKGFCSGSFKGFERRTTPMLEREQRCRIEGGSRFRRYCEGLRYLLQ